MRISQYVYFQLRSESVTAAVMTGELGVEPDAIKVRGTRRATPAVPKSHSWAIECRQSGLRLDEQASQVLTRLAPIQGKLIRLVTGLDVAASLVVVRFLDDEDGEDERFDAIITPGGELAEKIGGQHQLLGWYFPPEQLAFLASVQAAIWADEYG